MSRSLVLGVSCFVLAGALALAVGSPLTSNGTQPGLTYEMLPSGNCRGCHGFDYDPANYIEPGDTWQGTMKAQAARDPLLWAALDVANHDTPNVGEFCLRCHAPFGWLAGRSEPPGGSPDGCALQGPLDQAPGTDFNGVSCHLCHRMMINPSPPPGQQTFYLENAQFWIDDVDCGGWGEPCRHGPYDYLGPNEVPAPHTWIFSNYHLTSDICGNCHNVTHPARNLIVNGVDAGIRFPIQRTNREWRQSAFAAPGPTSKTCQECHMPDATVNPAYACAFSDNNRTGDMGVHEFAGGNSWVPDVLRQEYPALGLSTELAATRDTAVRLLQTQSAKLDLFAPAYATPGFSMPVKVKVTNLTGHKLPTGYPEGRRMWLDVVARDGAGAKIWESGAYDPATGVLTRDPATKVYETRVGIWNRNGAQTCDVADAQGNPIFHVVLDDCIAFDNRIPPLGFTGGADLDVQPVNYAYPETSPGAGVLVNYDITNYAIPIPPSAPPPVTVTATLRYQTVSKEFVGFLKDEAVADSFPDDCIPRTTGMPTASRGALLFDMWSRHGKAAPVDMASAARAAIFPATPGEAGREIPMRVAAYAPSSGTVTVGYGPACASTDHTVYIGPLSQVATTTFAAQVCGLGASGAATFPLGAGNLFWVIVGNEGASEGSYGTRSDGSERPEDTTLAACNIPQNLSRSCDPAPGPAR